MHFLFRVNVESNDRRSVEKKIMDGWKEGTYKTCPNDGRRRKQRQRPDVFNDFTGLVSAESVLGVYTMVTMGNRLPHMQNHLPARGPRSKWGPGTSGKQQVRQTNVTEIHQRLCLFLACSHPSAGKFHYYFRLTQTSSDPRSTMQFNVHHRQDTKRICLTMKSSLSLPLLLRNSLTINNSHTALTLKFTCSQVSRTFFFC